MAGTFKLSVVTPEREVLSTEARFVAFPAFDGEMGILPKRAALLTQLGAGHLRVEEASGAKKTLFVSGGFAQMIDDKLTLLTEEAREPESVDPAQAERALVEANAMPTATEAEFRKRSQAVQRARALLRSAHH